MSSNKKVIPISQLEIELRRLLPEILKEISVVYSPKELLTREEFQQALVLFQERFDAADKRFETANKRFEELLTHMNRRFEEASRERLELKAAIGALGRRSGIALERTILKIFRRTLELQGIDMEKVEKIGIRDEQGDLFRPGAKVEFDLYVHNDEHFLFEIKYHVTKQDIDLFLAKSNFFEQKKGVPTKKIVIALDIDDYVKHICEDYEIEVITGERPI